MWRASADLHRLLAADRAATFGELPDPMLDWPHCERGPAGPDAPLPPSVRVDHDTLIVRTDLAADGSVLTLVCARERVPLGLETLPRVLVVAGVAAATVTAAGDRVAPDAQARATRRSTTATQRSTTTSPPNAPSDPTDPRPPSSPDPTPRGPSEV